MLRSHTYRIAGILLFMVVVAAALPAYAASHKHPKPHDHSTHNHPNLCAGFVVLPNGYAVLSATEPASMSGMKHAMHHDKGHGMERKGHMQHGTKAEGTDHLLGYKHGDDIPIGKDTTCVSISDTTSTSWQAVSSSPGLHVTARSARGVLAHNSRANESLSFNIMLADKPVEQGKVRLVTRMPHHDRRMPGGHGPANDPDVQGLAASPQGNGEYTVPMIDFTMGGLWLFEIHVQHNGTMHRAYFATKIGEE